MKIAVMGDVKGNGAVLDRCIKEALWRGAEAFIYLSAEGMLYYNQTGMSKEDIEFCKDMAVDALDQDGRIQFAIFDNEDDCWDVEYISIITQRQKLNLAG